MLYGNVDSLQTSILKSLLQNNSKTYFSNTFDRVICIEIYYKLEHTSIPSSRHKSSRSYLEKVEDTSGYSQKGGKTRSHKDKQRSIKHVLHRKETNN